MLRDDLYCDMYFIMTAVPSKAGSELLIQEGSVIKWLINHSYDSQLAVHP